MKPGHRTTVTSVEYLSKLYPVIRPLPNSNKALKRLRRWGLESITTRTDEDNFQLDILDSKPVFSDLQDMKYVFFEKDLFTKLVDETSETKVFCDVGGYHGFYSIVSQSKKTHTFEMNSENHRRIEENLELNPERDIELWNKAVWSEETTVGASGSSGQSFVDGEGETNAVTLDAFFSERKDPEIIKIDVEGAEGHVLEGAEKLLKRSSPTLFIELHFGGRMESYGHSYSEIKDKLESLGYDLKTLQKRSSAKIIKAEA